MELVALLNPLALALNCLYVPAASISKSVKVTVPFPADVPMSRLVVPWSGPDPAASDKPTDKLLGNPTVELFPKASWLLTTGWVPNIDPAVALPGCVTNARAPAAAGLIAMLVEVVLTKLPLLNKMVMLVATLCDKLE